MTTTNITSGTDFIGKTLIIGSTALAMRDWGRVFDFNNNSTDTYVFSTGGGSGGSLHWFEYRHASENQNIWDSFSSSLNVYYIYVLSFVSNIQLKFNIYQYNSPSTIINDAFLTISIPNTFLSRLTHFWLGKSAYSADAFYNGIYNKVALYNGDLFALSEANILSTLLTVVTSTQTNIINNSTTYTFRALGTNFLGVVVNILNVNTTTGSDVTTSAITLNGTNSTTGGYLNIIGSYIETIPNAPAPTSELGSIYATTISSEKYIVIASQNIELSGNVIIKNDATLSSGLLYTNSLVPNVPNSASLGSIDKMWSNAYINDVSINNNLQVTGNVYISGNLEASNIYTKEEIDNSFTNVYTIAEFDNSYSNIYTRGYIDQSFQNVYTIEHIDQSFQNVYTRAQVDLSFANVYTRGAIDSSYANVYTRGVIDTSFANVYTRGVIDQSFANVYTRIQFDNSYANVYTRGHIDQSFANVYTRGRIDQSFANVYTKSQVDASFVTKSLFELSYNALVAIRGTASASGSGGTSVNSNIIPSSTSTYNLGSTSKYWNNAYINNLRLSNRAYQDISGGINDISWSAVNGYYGLAKDAYPSLNPQSNGELAVRTWIPRLTSPIWTTSIGITQFHWTSVCWSPYLGLFTSLSSGTDGATQSRSMWSVDGEHWNASEGVDYNNTLFTSICWSQEKYMFLAVANSGDRRLAYSYNGKKWFQWFNQAIIPLPLNSWSSICWSQELRIFVAVADDGGTNRVATGGATGGATGIENWTTYVPVSENNRWTSVCWSAELRLFVAVAREGTNRVMTSRTGHSWSLVLVSTPSTWSSICWSKELGIFVAVATTGSFNVMTSNNGINWTAISSGIDSSWNSVCWSGELEVFVAVAGNGTNRVMSSSNGITWTAITAAQANNWRSICWSPELGLFVAVSTNGSNRSMRTSLKSRPPTSYNVFNREFITNITFGFNSIDETGKWTFHNMAVRTLNVTGTFTNSSDDRLKHNEVIITNGLDVIEQLNPKFYQKTQTLLDASYNGDLSGQAWTYEAGLIAQELLQIPDLSFAVCGGDYYQESYISSNQTNDTSANYDICYNLIKQPYSLNYNSVFVYGVAAIKELHAKVKAQETNVLDEQLNNLITRIETMETALISPQ
jgi:hypothetical protein